MASLDFMILSKLMSYVFTFLGVMIVWRTFSWLRKDRRLTHKRLKALPDAGTIGVMTVLQGSDELPEGTVLPVPFEGVLGFVRTCDVVIPVDDVVAQHLDFTFRNGKGLYIYPRRGCPTAVDGVTLDSAADSRRYPMQHGSILCVGNAVLQLGVFAGLDVAQFSGAWQPQEPGAFGASSESGAYYPYGAYSAYDTHGTEDAEDAPLPPTRRKRRPDDEA
ncbi:MAG: hypothetical protein E7327_10240 [Clostridiales bacterium]|nr:hypothetical protein [Clostridiales bacterium]